MNNAYSSFEHLVLSVCSDRGKRWKFVMVNAQTVYVDDSGTDPKSNIAAAAFCVSTVDKWQEFLERWQQIADHAEFELKNFHMTEFAACRRDRICPKCRNGKSSAREHPWQNWTEGKRHNVLRQLARALVKTVECGWGVAYVKEDYKTHVLNSPVLSKAGEPIGKEPFTFAVQLCGGSFAEWRSQNKRSDKLKFVFDTSSEKERYEINNVFFDGVNGSSPRVVNGIEQWLDPQLGVSFESRKVTHQLLAPDMLVWTTACIRARELTMRGRFVELFQIAPIFVDTQHIKIGHVSKGTIAEWERNKLNESGIS
jgi:hypothetical protein